MRSIENNPNSKKIGWIEEPLGSILPIKYGKARSEGLGFSRPKTKIFGSNGPFDLFDRALTSGPALIIGRKGAAGSVHYSSEPCWPIDTAFYAEAVEGIHLPFFSYLLQSLQLVRLDKSTAIPSLSRDDYNSRIVRFPASVAEQQRIVATIEELFSELDKGIENLKQAKAQVAVYRQALLKDALEGKLTADWRKAHKDQLEARDKLLARIRKERDAHDFSARDGKTVRSRRNAPEWSLPSDSEAAALGHLPHGWAWIRLGNLCSSVRNGISLKPAATSGEKILRISAVRPMRIDLGDYRLIEDPTNAFADYVLETGDLLFTRYNGSRKFVGVCGLFRGHEQRLFPDKLIRAKIGVESILPAFVEAAVSCGPSRAFIESRIRTTAGQAGVSGADIKAIPVPVCSKAEQQEILSILDKALPHIESLESEIDINLAKSEGLRQSILKKAFVGELVPQDANECRILGGEGDIRKPRVQNGHQIYA